MNIPNKRLFTIACILILIGVCLCSYSLLTHNTTSNEVKNNTINYQGIIITVESSSIEVLKNNDTILEFIDQDNNTKYTYEVCSANNSGDFARTLIVEHHGVAYSIGDGNYIVGYVTQLEGNKDENFNATSLILDATKGTLIDFNDLVNKNSN